MAALVPYSTTAQMDTAIAAAVGAIDLSGYSTIAAPDAALAAALVPYSTTAQMDAAIAAAVGAIDLSGYSTITARDAAIAAALVPYSTTVQMDGGHCGGPGRLRALDRAPGPHHINEINIALTDYTGTKRRRARRSRARLAARASSQRRRGTRDTTP